MRNLLIAQVTRVHSRSLFFTHTKHTCRGSTQLCVCVCVCVCVCMCVYVCVYAIGHGSRSLIGNTASVLLASPSLSSCIYVYCCDPHTDSLPRLHGGDRSPWQVKGIVYPKRWNEILLYIQCGLLRVEEEEGANLSCVFYGAISTEYNIWETQQQCLFPLCNDTHCNPQVSLWTSEWRTAFY